MDEELLEIVKEGKEAELKQMLKENPQLELTGIDDFGFTLLHWACVKGHDKILALLLAQPGVNANQKTAMGETPFYMAFCYEKSACVRLLLKDDRVNPNEPDDVGSSPLYNAALFGYVDIVKWWVASGREIGSADCEDAITVAREPTNEVGEEDAEFEQRSERCAAVAALLERYQEDRQRTTHEVRAEVGWYDGEAAQFFALVVFTSDGLLEIREQDGGEQGRAIRFMRMICQLPMELQMLLCHRVVGSAAENIIGEQREVAFKTLTRQILTS